MPFLLLDALTIGLALLKTLNSGFVGLTPLRLMPLLIGEIALAGE